PARRPVRAAPPPGARRRAAHARPQRDARHGRDRAQPLGPPAARPRLDRDPHRRRPARAHAVDHHRGARHPRRGRADVDGGATAHERRARRQLGRGDAHAARGHGECRAMTRPRIHYAWYVAATPYVVLLCAAAVRATPRVIIVPLQEEFGWSRALISGAISVNLLLYGLVGPFAAAIMQRFGIRRTIMIALAVMAAGVALTNRMTEPWQLYASWGLLVGVAAGSMATVLGATIVQRWFASRRGLMMGVLTASAATGQLVFLPIMAAFVVSDGWQPVVLIIALVLLAIIPIVGLVIRD